MLSSTWRHYPEDVLPISFSYLAWVRYLVALVTIFSDISLLFAIMNFHLIID